MEQTVGEFYCKYPLTLGTMAHPKTSVRVCIDLLECSLENTVHIIENEILLGIFGKQDLLHLSFAEDKSSSLLDEPVKNVMRKEFLFISTNQTLEVCHKLLVLSRLTELPLISSDSGKWLGQVKLIDISNHLMRQKEFLLDQLQSYLYGSPPRKPLGDAYENLSLLTYPQFKIDNQSHLNRKI